MIDFGLVASLIVAIGLPALLATRWRDTGEPGSSFLDDVIGPEYDRLVHAVDEARSRLGPRDVPFDEWSQRWSAALADLDGLLSHVGAGDIDAAVDHIVSTVRPSREPS